MDTRIAGSCWWHVGLDTPRSGVEKRVWSPPPAMGRRRGGPRPSGQGLVVGGGRGHRVLMGLPRPEDGVLGWTPRPSGQGGEEN